MYVWWVLSDEIIDLTHYYSIFSMLFLLLSSLTRMLPFVAVDMILVCTLYYIPHTDERYQQALKTL